MNLQDQLVAENEAKGYVYRDNCELVHVPDGVRRFVGQLVAGHVDELIRRVAKDDPEGKDLCPGCYGVVMINALVELAKANGQSLKELGNSMAANFAMIAELENYDDALVEDMKVLADHPLDMAA